MRKIWFFGDSSTYGHGLRPGFKYHDESSIKKPLWTELVSKYYNGEEINFGLCGASNDDIKFRITTNLYKINKNDIVFIQYGHPTRINIFDNNNDYKSVHVAFNNSFGFGNEKDEILKKYFNNFIIDNIEKYEIRDFIIFLSLKKEIETKGIKCILWSHEIISETFRNYKKWDSIYDESGGQYDDKYHLGFNSQSKFFNFLIDNILENKTLIKPENLSNGMFNISEFDYSVLDDLYKEVSNSDIHKKYDESHIFF